MKKNKFFKKVKKLIINNFKFDMKKPADDLSRGEAFVKDKEVYHEKNGETWSVFGDVTGFCYREGLPTKEKADDYVSELNKNRKNIEY